MEGKNWDPHFVLPPADDPRNFMDYYLRSKVIDVWFKAFTALGEFQNPKEQVAIVSTEKYNPFSRSASVIDLTLTFDHKIMTK
jgi:hypothetical protein